MLERRIIRIAIPYSRTLYYNDKGRERGITAENARDFERWLNQRYAKQLGKRPLTVYIIPTTRDDLMPDVTGGVADIAAGNITVTEQRLKLVDFVAPEDQRPIAELVVSRATAPVATAEDLSGRTVHVRPSSSYFNSLEALNAKLKQAGKAPAKLVQVPDELEDEDMMEMLNAGVIENIVVDDWKAKVWAQILPNIKVNEGAVVREGGKVGWAVRKDSPKLQAEILAFWKDYLKKQGVAEYRMKQAMSRVKQMKNNATDAEYKKFVATLDLFRKYGPKYGFDPIMLAAQGYQESTLNQNAKSHVGAIGVMQIMPATGAELKVGDITQLEPNIHGGAKYMDKLMTQYFKDAKFSEYQPRAVRVRELQLRPGQRLEDAQGGREARPRPGQVVQQRGAGDRREDRHRDHHLRAQHLQVLRLVPAHVREQAGGREGEGVGRRRAGEVIGRAGPGGVNDRAGPGEVNDRAGPGAGITPRARQAA